MAAAAHRINRSVSGHTDGPKSSMAQQRYSILEKIDAGGMAEVFKGKAASLRGFEKLVAIKRVLPALSKNTKFIGMFLDEARLSLHLNHANVVQTFDIGMTDNAYFIVMEWIDGSNLKGLLETIVDRQMRLPREQAVYIAIEICKGLSHAHNRKDPDGRPLNIVHRDVSPPNVLLSREGEVKLVDFGLAKAASQVSITDPGVVKGKFGYLSPEAAYGKAVDVRADVFATGIVLWEMLAGRRLFEGATDLATVEQVRAARVPSLLGHVQDLEPRLEAIIAKALARDPRERYQSTEALGHDLARYLFEHKLLVTSYDIAMLVKRVLALRDERRRNAPQNNSTMARVNAEVQAEMGQFTSLEDLAKMKFVSVAQGGDSDPDMDDGSIDGEDPRGWASELGMIGDEDTILDPSAGGRFGGQGNAPPPGQRRQVRIAPPPEPVQDEPSQLRRGPQTADSARIRVNEARAASEGEGRGGTSRLTAVLIGLAVGLLGVAGAVWFMLRN